MRYDIEGMFWDEVPPPKPPPKEKIKRTPPEPTWENEDYLPHLEEALAFDVRLFTDIELVNAQKAGEHLILDIESYKNYWLIAFKSAVSGLVVYFEKEEDGVINNEAKLRWIMDNFTTISFNGIGYDLPMLAIALAGYNTPTLKEASDLIIQTDIRIYQLLKKYKVQAIACDHIDIMQVAPLKGSLKVYAGRLHSRRMQDLPFKPELWLNENQIAITRLYCVNDLDNTIDLFHALEEPLELRKALTAEYEIDLRSKSDAQISEAVISSEIQKITKKRIPRAHIAPGTVYKYDVPYFIEYKSELMNWALDIVRNTEFVVGEKGSVECPDEFNNIAIPMGHSTYGLCIGGLHSREKSATHYADNLTSLDDWDVTSYYPRIVLNQRLFPKHLGPTFLKVFRRIVERRLAAKAAGDKSTADSLKIVINSAFGKLGSRFSIFYAPDLLIQVTLTGQLSLLMLVERFELAGLPVVSGNTDGVVVKCPIEREAEMEAIIKQWESDTQFNMERTPYKAIHSRDVNNYIAVKLSGGYKTKGTYARAGLSKNPTNEICIDALEALLANDVPIETTIKNCKDINKFLAVRAVKGGGVKDGEFLGKVIRWYYANPTDEEKPEDYRDEIVYAKSGNKVPRSDGAKPMMDKPAEFPNDLNHDWYIEETNSILKDIGVICEEEDA
tara:strand:- start:3837 stop:5846 length:2010 start_codon:yes stop_codon:yes gene_type:complete